MLLLVKFNMFDMYNNILLPLVVLFVFTCTEQLLCCCPPSDMSKKIKTTFVLLSIILEKKQRKVTGCKVIF